MSLKMLALWQLRFFQAYRILKSVGWILLAVFAFSSIGIALPMLDYLLQFPRIFTVPILLVLIFILDIYRRDKLFLRSIFTYRRVLIFYMSTEYFLLSGPVWIFHCWKFGISGMVTIIPAGIVAFFSPYVAYSATVPIKKSIFFIPIKLFEVRF